MIVSNKRRQNERKQYRITLYSIGKMDRKKQLIMEYKEKKTDMGIICIKNKITDESFFKPHKDTKSYLNRCIFQLNANSHPNYELQEQWQNLGSENFDVFIIEYLPYDKKHPEKTDYTKDLNNLCEKYLNTTKNSKKL